MESFSANPARSGRRQSEADEEDEARRPRSRRSQTRDVRCRCGSFPFAAVRPPAGTRTGRDCASQRANPGTPSSRGRAMAVAAFSGRGSRRRPPRAWFAPVACTAFDPTPTRSTAEWDIRLVLDRLHLRTAALAWTPVRRRLGLPRRSYRSPPVASQLRDRRQRAAARSTAGPVPVPERRMRSPLASAVAQPRAPGPASPP